MNKPRKPRTVEGAVSSALGEFDDDDFKQITGKSRALGLKWADPDCEAHHIPFYQAANLAAALNAHGVEERFSEAFRGSRDRALIAFGGAPKHSALDPSDRILTLVEAVGNACGELRMAQDPKSPAGREYSICEKSEITGKLQEIIDHAKLCIKDLEG